jgi:predicted dehydrogenase
MNLAILGAGMIVKDFLLISKDMPQIKIQAIFGTEHDMDTMIFLKDKYRIEEIYTDIDACLHNDRVDTVYVALPNHLHYEYSKKALELGKNVICEKPFTMSIEQAIDLEKIAKKNKLIILEAITNQYLSNNRVIKESLNELGDIKIVECNYSQYSSRYDAFKSGEILPAFNPTKGGGALMDINIYNIHFVVGLFGNPISVNYFANIENNIDTSGMLVLDYGDFKVNCVGAKDSTSEIKSTIQGTLGSIIVVGPTNSIQEFNKVINNKSNEKFNFNKHSHRMYEEFISFYKIITEQDFKEANQRMEHTKSVLKIVELALKNAGVKIG